MEQTILKDIIARLEKIEQNTNGKMEQEFAVLKESNILLWKHHDTSATEFRKAITAEIAKNSAKIDILQDTLNHKPCSEHSTDFRWMKGTLYGLVGFVTALVVEAIKRMIH